MRKPQGPSFPPSSASGHDSDQAALRNRTLTRAHRLERNRGREQAKRDGLPPILPHLSVQYPSGLEKLEMSFDCCSFTSRGFRYLSVLLTSIKRSFLTDGSRELWTKGEKEQSVYGGSIRARRRQHSSLRCGRSMARVAPGITSPSQPYLALLMPLS